MADDDEFRLTPDQRERLRPGVDPAALERPLSALPRAVHTEIVGWFLKGGEGDTAGWAGLNLVGDPELERLFAAVWKSGRGGQRQPQTLEVLLMTPMSAETLISGKLIALTLYGTVIALCALIIAAGLGAVRS
jgi:ABC-type Na+ efflux pump, permease component